MDEQQLRLEGQRWHCAGRISAEQYSDWVRSADLKKHVIYVREDESKWTLLVHFPRPPFGVQMVYEVNKSTEQIGLMWAGPAIHRGKRMDISVDSIEVIEKGYTSLIKGRYGDDSEIALYNPYHLRDADTYVPGRSYSFMVGGFIYELHTVDRPPYDWRRERKKQWLQRSDVRKSPFFDLSKMMMELGFYAKGCVGSEHLDHRPGDVIALGPVTRLERFRWEKEPMFEAEITMFAVFEPRQKHDVPLWGIADSVKGDWPAVGDDVDAWVWLQGCLTRDAAVPK